MEHFVHENSRELLAAAVQHDGSRTQKGSGVNRAAPIDEARPGPDPKRLARYPRQTRKQRTDPLCMATVLKHEEAGDCNLSYCCRAHLGSFITPRAQSG
jgi:hypothetical protein